MAATEVKDATTRREDATSVRLRTPVYQTIAEAKGYKTVASQAIWHGLARSAMFRLRSGGRPSLDTYMRIAADCGVPVDAVWERVA